jgi:hypothetical protein
VVLAILTTLMIPMGKTLWYRMLGISGSITILEVTPTSTERAGDEGCSPGFWKQEHHFHYWPEPYMPDTTLGFFATPGDSSPLTLLQALDLGGGGLNALWRQTVAALLNAAHLEIDFPFETEDVLSLLQDALSTGAYEPLKDLFEQANEGTCPLGEPEDSPDPTTTPTPDAESQELPGQEESPTPTPTTAPAEPPEVCGAGFWAAPDHAVWWPAPYQPAGSFASAFDLSPDFGLSLQGALELQGDELPGLMREAVAATLNASSDAVDYPLSAAQVIEAFRGAFESEDPAAISSLYTQLKEFNQGECPFESRAATATPTPQEESEPAEPTPTPSPDAPASEETTPEDALTPTPGAEP